MTILKKLVLSIILFTTHSVLSQVNSGIVTYSVKPLSLVDANTPPDKIAILESIYATREYKSETTEYQLNFNNTKSIFFKKNDVSSSDRVPSKYYIISDESFETKSFFGQDFIVYNKLSDIPWVLHKEHKKIGKYTCFKASHTTKSLSNFKNQKDINIIAWYCPEIPVLHGPKGFGALPGLILELAIDKDYVYTMKEIVFNPKESIVIDKPTKGKIVTEREYKEAFEKTIYSFRKKSIKNK